MNKNTWVLVTGIVLTGCCLSLFVGQLVYLHQRGTAGLAFNPFRPASENKSLFEEPSLLKLLLAPGKVTQVMDNGPAETAGILTSDQVVSVNGIPISDVEKIRTLESSVRPDNSLTYVLERGDNESVTIQIERFSHIPEWATALAIYIGAGLCFWCIGWVVFLKKRNDRRAVVIFWMSILSGILCFNLYLWNSMPFAGGGWSSWSGLEAFSGEGISVLSSFFLAGLRIVLTPVALHLALIFPHEQPTLMKHPTAIRWIYGLIISFVLGPVLVGAPAYTVLGSILAFAAVLGRWMQLRLEGEELQGGWIRWVTSYPSHMLFAVWLSLSIIMQLLRQLLTPPNPSDPVDPLLLQMWWIIRLLPIIVTLNVLYPVATCWILFRSYRENTIEEDKQRVKWPLVGMLTFIVSGIVFFVMSAFGAKVLTRPFAITEGSLMPMLSLLVPVSFGVAILKYRLLDIVLIIKRTAQYSLFTGMILAVYFSLAGGLSDVLVNITGMRKEAVIIAATVIVAAAFWPILNRVQRMLEHHFFYKRYEYPVRLKVLDNHLREASSIASLQELVLESVQQTLGTGGAVFFLKGEVGTFHAAARVGLADAGLGPLSLNLDPAGMQELQHIQEVREFNWAQEETEILNAIKSELLVVIRSKGKMLGLLSLAPKRSREDYDAEDREFLTNLADKTAAGIENQRLQEQEREFERGREIQEAFLPKHIPSIEGYSIAGTWRPARKVSGDYYDIFIVSAGRLALCIADVAGKGLAAALLMSRLQAVVRILAADDLEPKHLCEHLNRAICSNVAPGQYITFFYSVLSVKAKRLVYTNCGHNWPFLMRSDGSVVRLKEGGLVLGITSTVSYEQSEVTLARGDRLLLFTDGISEAANADQEEFGEDRLGELIMAGDDGTAGQLQLRLINEISQFCSSHFQDDATMVTLIVE